MAVFDYKAKNPDGETLVGAVVAPSENVAYGLLKDKELFIISLRERRKFPLLSSLKFFKRVKGKDVVIFSRQLSTMVSANVPLVKALKTLVRQTQNVNLKSIVSDLADEIDGGAKLSITMSRYPNVFSNFFVQMIRSAETTGKLDEILIYLSDQMEKDYDLISKLRGALIYPAFIVSGIIAVGAMMMIFVLPQLLSVLQEGGAQLPLSTRIIIGVSGFLTTKWWLILLVVIGLVVGFRFGIRTPGGRRLIDRLKLKTPVFGSIFTRTYLTRFCRSLSTLLASGVPLPQALEIVADVVGNVIYQDLTRQTIDEVEGGNSITTVFAKSDDIPAMLSQMMSVGEQSGRLDQILGKLADFYSRELENLLRNLVTLIEPVVMVLLGIGVAILVAGILLPIYNLSSAI